MRPGFFLALTLLCACSKPGFELTFFFPDEDAKARTTAISALAFVPLLEEELQGLRFLSCDEVGHFGASQRFSPEVLEDEGLQVLQKLQRSAYPLDSFALSFSPPDLSANPSGVMSIYVQAEGEAPLLQGCVCVRMNDAQHPDPEVERAIRESCPLIDQAEFDVALSALPAPEFHLSGCHDLEGVTMISGRPVSPGPAMCLSTVPCSPTLRVDCYDVGAGADRISLLGDAPVLFEVRTERGDVATSQVVLTSQNGRAQSELSVDRCEEGMTLTASVIGRAEEQVFYPVRCAADIQDYQCGFEQSLPSDLEILSITSLGPGLVALLGVGAERDETQVLLRGTMEQTITLAGERGLAMHAVQADLLAVATEVDERPVLRMYRLEGGGLVEQDVPLEGPCARWQCGSQTVCANDMGCLAGEACFEGRCTKVETDALGCGGPPAHCACEQVVVPSADGALRAADINGDGLPDLVLSISGASPVVFYFAEEVMGTLRYSASRCSCGAFGGSPKSFELLSFGGASAADPDLFFISGGAAFVNYAFAIEGQSALLCGGSISAGFGSGGVATARGRFGCEDCPLQDAVVLSLGDAGQEGGARLLFGGGEAPPLDLDAGKSLTLSSMTAQGVPKALAVGDLNDDARDDLAVLFGDEVRVWLGARIGAVAQTSSLDLTLCAPGAACNAAPALTLQDMDGDGRADIVAACEGRLVWYRGL